MQKDDIKNLNNNVKKDETKFSNNNNVQNNKIKFTDSDKLQDQEVEKEELNNKDKTNAFNLEDYEHLTVVQKKDYKEKQFNTAYENFESSENKSKKSKNFFTWVKNLYGLGNDEDDLKFVYETYSNANDSIAKSSKIVFYLIVFIFATFIIWASFEEIDELARGQGKVIPLNKIQTVQSLDGGIISDIFIKDGDEVKKGQPLIKIDTTRFAASLEESKQEYLSFLAVKSRLSIESRIDINKPMPKMVFDKIVLEDAPDYAMSEKLLFKNRFNELKSSIEVLKLQKSQKKQELVEKRNRIEKLKKSLRYITEKRKTMKKLVARGIKSNYELLDTEKEYTQTNGDLEGAQLSVPRLKFAIQEADSKIEEKISIFKSEASKKLKEVIANINKYEAKLIGATDKVSKTTLESPVDGIIKQVYFNTIGGVVKSGMDLIDIVPSSDGLLVEAKIDPRDIAFISPTQKVIIKITAYDFSIYGGLDGKIVEISADSIVDKDSRDKKSYYRVLIKTDKNFLEIRGRKYPIIPGMIATVDIVTGKKTILDFLLKPILKVKQDALHER